MVKENKASLMSDPEAESLYLTLLLPELRELIRAALTSIWSTRGRVGLQRTCRQLKKEDPGDLTPAMWQELRLHVGTCYIHVDPDSLAPLYPMIWEVAKDMPESWPAPSSIVLGVQAIGGRRRLIVDLRSVEIDVTLTWDTAYPLCKVHVSSKASRWTIKLTCMGMSPHNCGYYSLRALAIAEPVSAFLGIADHSAANDALNAFAARSLTR